MKKIIEEIKKFYPIPARSLQELVSLLQRLELPRGQLLFKTGKLEYKVYFIEKGMARAICYKEEKEVTFWFGVKGNIVLTYYSYIAGKPGYETVKLLENSVLCSIDLNAIQALFKQDIHLAIWGRKLAEYELVKTEERFISVQFHTAIERYKAL